MRKVITAIIAILVIIGVIFGIVTLIKSNNKDNLKGKNNGEVIESLDNQNNSETTEDTEMNNLTGNSKILVAYFTLPETTGDAKEDSTVTVNGETLGNTQYVANLIKEHTGADIFRIEPVKEYNTSDHAELIADAKKEQEDDSRPEIKNKI